MTRASQTDRQAQPEVTQAECLVGGLRIGFRRHAQTGRPLDALLADYDRTPLGAEPCRWTVTLAAPAPEFAIHVDADARAVVVRAELGTPLDLGVHHALERILLLHDRLPVHAALVTRGPQHPALLLMGDSGNGKSSLCLLAILAGWHVVTDDLAALRADADGVLGASVRRRLRIPMPLAEPLLRAGQRRPPRSVPKMRFDPEALRQGAFLREARIGRVVFLERGSARAFAPLSPGETLERLLCLYGRALSFAKGRPFALLQRLARIGHARVARLTAECLTSPDVLDALAA